MSSRNHHRSRGTPPYGLLGSHRIPTASPLIDNHLWNPGIFQVMDDSKIVVKDLQLDDRLPFMNYPLPRSVFERWSVFTAVISG